MKYWMLSCYLFVIGCNQNEREVAPQLLRVSYDSEATQKERDFFLYLPETYESDTSSYPLLLFLHGNGERGNGKEDLDFVLKHGPLYEAWIQKRNLPFIMVAPQLPLFGMDEKYSYIANRSRDEIPVRLEHGVPPRPDRFPTNELMTGALMDTNMIFGSRGLPKGWPEIEDELIQMVDMVSDQYRVDKRRVYLTGLSYGGFGSWYMASKYPQRFAAVAPVVGYGHPDLMASIAKNQIPVWAFAGGRDPVVSVKYFYPGLNELEKLGLKELRFTTHEDMGHDAWVRVYEGDDLYNWMLRFQK